LGQASGNGAGRCRETGELRGYPENYCLTLTTAVCGFAITLQRPLVALLALVPILIFAVLDAQYLRIERRFRGLFDQLREKDWSQLPTFEIGLKAAPPSGYWDAFTSWSIFIFYVPLAFAVGAVVLVAGCIYGRYL
jgi:histidine triad (HIT) family protein